MINDIARELLALFNGHAGVTMIIGTGKYYRDEVYSYIRDKGISVCDNIRIKEYIESMDLHLMSCDLVISRAGALSVAETTVCGKAAILIPSPNVTGNHQYYNAKSVADRGGALLFEEKDLSISRVAETVLSLKNDKERLAAMSAASRACAPVRALDIIYEKIHGTAAELAWPIAGVSAADRRS